MYLALYKLLVSKEVLRAVPDLFWELLSWKTSVICPKINGLTSQPIFTGLRLDDFPFIYNKVDWADDTF